MAEMAQRPTSSSPLRKSTLKMVRGTILAAHSAAGVAAAASRKAERLIRSALGILRAAAALLEPAVGVQITLITHGLLDLSEPAVGVTESLVAVFVVVIHAEGRALSSAMVIVE